MNTLDFWKNVKQLSVDEFMCLQFEIEPEPGMMRFRFDNQKDWPKGSVAIFRKLLEDIGTKKLHITFSDWSLDPFVNDYLSDSLSNPESYWWIDGKLFKRQLVRWLTENEFPSKFFGVTLTEKKTEGANTIDVGPDQHVEFQTPPKSTGSRKDIVRMKETRQACNDVREELYDEKRVFDTDRGNWNPKLLFSTGKTTKEAFMTAVQKRLGGKPHRDAAVEEWKAVPTDLKHRGRVPEQ